MLGEPGNHDQRLVAAYALGVVVFVLGCCWLPAGKYIDDEPYDYAMPEAMLDLPASGDDVRPLPTATDVVWDGCIAPYAHGKCTRIVAMRSADGVSRDALLELLVQHYRSLGWPLVPRGSPYVGCRLVRGIIAWQEHCMEIHIRPSAEFMIGRPEIPEAVNVYVR
jgi:hypothetical protein